ncbi:hypothetical protein PF007_g32118 [Phytophthora fragariae]|uniref:Uncharacterized protein n=1 Tax=Phytophthora fragariae TaxID=53985 RepID=A0A6A3PKB2_9STRA|nr:hypothetical protein PF007_g32118 [Phytophthora fragariae]
MGIMAQHLKMDLGQKDVKARILDYFDCMEEVIEVHGLGKILKSNARLKCKIIVENLRPGTLKDQVKRAIEYDPALKADLHHLFDVVKQEAIKNQQAFDLYQRMDKRDSGNKDNRHKKQLGLTRSSSTMTRSRPSMTKSRATMTIEDQHRGQRTGIAKLSEEL